DTTFVTGPYQFDTSALSGNNLYLPSHGFATGDAVVYRAPKDQNGVAVPLGGLTDNTVYYVIRLDANDIQLTDKPEYASLGTAIALSFPTASSTATAPAVHTLTDLGAGQRFQGSAVGGDGTLNLKNHSFQTGQMVVYRAGSGQDAASTIGGLTDDG